MRGFSIFLGHPWRERLAENTTTVVLFFVTETRKVRPNYEVLQSSKALLWGAPDFLGTADMLVKGASATCLQLFLMNFACGPRIQPRWVNSLLARPSRTHTSAAPSYDIMIVLSSRMKRAKSMSEECMQAIFANMRLTTVLSALLDISDCLIACGPHVKRYKARDAQLARYPWHCFCAPQWPRLGTHNSHKVQYGFKKNIQVVVKECNSRE